MGIALKTDLYQLTMLAGYYHSGKKDLIVTCEAFARKLPEERQFLVVAGIDKIKKYLDNLRFDNEDIEYMKSVPNLKDYMTSGFIEYLHNFSFDGVLEHFEDGQIVLQNEPIVRVTAPIIQAQLVETFILSTLNHSMTIASKAARIRRVAPNKQLFEFGSRRTHDEAAVDAARAAYLAGFDATSNVEAGFRFGIPVVGTVAHMWTMTHKNELEAFNAQKSFSNSNDSKLTFLIDTYDPIQGVSNAMAVTDSDKSRLGAIRLDSGDIDSLTKTFRYMLDASGFNHTKIIVSGDMDEYKIKKLIDSAAPIDSFGVGTALVTSDDRPSLGIVYKLVEIYDVDNGSSVGCAKSSSGKMTYAGTKQVTRFDSGPYHSNYDVIHLASEEILNGENGTEMIFDHFTEKTLVEQRKNCLDNILKFSHYEVVISDGVKKFTEEALARAKE